MYLLLELVLNMTFGFVLILTAIVNELPFSKIKNIYHENYFVATA